MDFRLWLADAVPASTARRFIVVGGISALALAALLYQLWPALYFSTLPVFFFFDHPFRYPFHDIGGVMSTVECWRAGVDVYLSNPCDTENRAWPYSPLFLRVWLLPTNHAHLPLVGGLLALGFLFSQCLLPQPERRFDLCLVMAALFSSSVVFAVERANIDLLIFILLVLVVRGLSLPIGGRALAYGLIAFGGFLKFYPFVAIAVALRERVGLLVIVLGLFALACGIYIWYYQSEIEQALLVVRSMDGYWGPFSDRFGARQLAAGLWVLFGEQGYKNLGALLHRPTPGISVLLVIAMFLGCLSTAMRMANMPAQRLRWQALPSQQIDFLVAGSLIFVGCFFAGYSNSYRAIFLLLVLPGLLALSRTQFDPVPRWLRWAPFALLYSMWAPTTQHLIQYVAKLLATPLTGSLVLLLDWLLHELAWWWLATVCMTVVISYLFNSPIFLTLTAWRKARG